MSHPFNSYFRKHGHYPKVAVRSGVQKITVEFCPGYVSIYSSSPYQAKVYITRSAVIELFRKAIPILRVLANSHHPDFDVPQAIHQDYLDEMAMARALRQE